MQAQHLDAAAAGAAAGGWRIVIAVSTCTAAARHDCQSPDQVCCMSQFEVGCVVCQQVLNAAKDKLRQLLLLLCITSFQLHLLLLRRLMLLLL
jgi:hypothetical protein